jgi:hypothetical protein
VADPDIDKLKLGTWRIDYEIVTRKWMSTDRLRIREPANQGAAVRILAGSRSTAILSELLMSLVAEL